MTVAQAAPRDAEAEHRNKKQVEPDIQHSRSGEKNERRRRIAQRAKKAGKEAVYRARDEPRKDYQQILPHPRQHLSRHTKKYKYRTEQYIHQRAQRRRQRHDEHERMPYRRAQPRLVTPAAARREHSSSAEVQSDGYRGQKCHQRIGRAYRRERDLPEHAPDDERIRNIIKLLEQASRHYRQRKKHEAASYRPLRKIPVH